MVITNEDRDFAVTKVNEFQQLLNSLPESSRSAAAQSISWRAVARALPFFTVENPEHYAHAEFWPIVLRLFSGLFLSRAAIKYPSEINRSDFGSLWSMLAGDADGLHGVSSGIATAVSLIARSASTESRESIGIAVQALHTASLIFVDDVADGGSAFWGAIDADRQFILESADVRPLINVPLWGRRESVSWTSANTRFAELLLAMDRTILPNGDVGGDWQVWGDWYRSRVEGQPTWGLKSTKLRRKVLDRIAIGDNRADFWTRHPAVVNADIAIWLRAAGSGTGKVEPTEEVAATTLHSSDTSTKPPMSKKPQSKSRRPTIKGSASLIDDADSMKAEAKNSSPPALDPAQKRADLEPLADTVDGSVDHLKRANIAYALAGRINEVWDQMNKPRDKPQGEAPGFVIHIDAPWGGGKSTFAEYIAQILNPYSIKGPLPEWLKALPIGKDGTWPERFRRPWHIVRFNAWQHQHVSPPWWVFYDAIRQTCTKVTGEDANHREEAFPQPLVDFGYRSAAIQRWKAFELLAREYLWRFATPTILINTALLFAIVLLLWMLTHLGLATFDLEKGFSQGGGAADAAKSAAQTVTGAAKAREATDGGGGLGLIPTVLVTLFGGGAAVWKIVGAFSASLVPGTPDAAKNYSLGSGDPLKRMRKHFSAMMAQVYRPVLVIVDDLDRCEPAFVVELVRGMQTILTSPRVVYLLLGDRDWIEQSFTEVHKAMKGVEVGLEHRFGGRFVEKAIQFSMVLPDVSEEGRQDYVRQILTDGGKAVATERVTAAPSVLESTVVPESQRQTVENLKADAKAVLETDDYELRERGARSLADKYDLDQLAVPKAAFEQEMAQKLFFRAATDKTAERATSHMIEGMASILPANPRQIKRIINTLSLLGQVLRIKDPAKRPGSADWQLLARWVVLMVEWPKSWFTLTRHPGLADVVLAMAQGKDEAETAAIEMRNAAAGLLPQGGLRSTSKLLAANATVMRAINFVESDWAFRPITSSEILWLREVMPAASGQVLQPPQQEKLASSDPAAATGKMA